MFLSVVPRPAVPEYVLHQVLWGYFPNIDRGEQRPFVFRVEPGRIIVLSRTAPSCTSLRIADRIHAGQVLQFEVLASAANCVAGRRRVEITDNCARRAWLARRMDGAVITFSQVYDRLQLQFVKSGGKKITVPRFKAVGTVHVQDRAAFIAAMLHGIGGRGCWGCGLLLLPEIMPEVCRGAVDRYRAIA